MNATETMSNKVNGDETIKDKRTPLARLRQLMERTSEEYNQIISEMRPGEMDMGELFETTDLMMQLSNTMSGNVGRLLIQEVRNLCTPSRRLPDLVFTYRVNADDETHCIFDYRDEKQWNRFMDKHANSIFQPQRNPFDNTQRFRFHFRNRDGTPAMGTMEGTFEQYQEKTKGQTIIVDAILI